MTKDHLIALEWAIEQISNACEGPSLVTIRRLELLRDLHFNGLATCYAFDPSRSALVSFMQKHGLTIPQAEFDQWRMVLPRDVRNGSLLTCPKCKTVMRIAKGMVVPSIEDQSKKASVLLDHRPDYCRCGYELTGLQSEPVLVDELLIGEISGLPESRGILRATNGVLCFIEKSDGTIYEGHVQHFIIDKEASKPVKINHDGTVKKERARDMVLYLYA